MILALKVRKGPRAQEFRKPLEAGEARKQLFPESPEDRACHTSLQTSETASDF